MKSRERLLLGVLLAFLIVAVVGGAGYFFVLDPYLTLSSELREERKQLLDKETELKKEEGLDGKLFKDPNFTRLEEICFAGGVAAQ